jgi:tetratricopeptide (TPR) repeat protein
MLRFVSLSSAPVRRLSRGAILLNPLRLDSRIEEEHLECYKEWSTTSLCARSALAEALFSTMLFARILCLLSTIANLALAGLAHAQALCDGSRGWSEMRADQQQLASLLKSRQFSALESALQDRQEQYEGGHYRDEDLSWSFDTFNRSDPAWTPLIEEWFDKYPRSYAARLGRAIHKMALGYAARGDKFRDKTSNEQFAALGRLLQAADKDLRISRTLTQKPTISFVYQIDIEKAIGDRASVDATLAEALKIAPESAMVRASYAAAISPKWQGSFSDLTAFGRAVQASNLGKSAKAYVTFVVEQEQGMAYWAAKEYDAAAEHYRKAAQYCKLSWPWRHQANMFNEAHRWQDALNALERYLELEPDQAWAIRRKGYAYQQLRQMTKAVAFYKEAADLGDSYAQNAYGWYLLEGRVVPKDLPTAIRLFRAALEQGNEEAGANLRAALAQQSK